jgi:hypothetical protein
VLFDTNRSWDEDSVWQMMERSWVAAYGDVKYVVDGLQPRDIVFYSHRWEGLIAAAEVIGPARDEGPDTRYRQVRFLTSVPNEKKASLSECRSQRYQPRQERPSFGRV